jgi:Fumarylacetoacetate (FAA) hydrolase family
VRIANISGRLTLVSDEGGIDVETASAGRFGPDPQAVYEQWQAFREWAEQAPSQAAVSVDDAVPVDNSALGAPAPRPAQVFAIGLNYRDHAAEAGLDVPASPATFTKFPTCLTGPFADVVLPSEYADWEVDSSWSSGYARTVRARHAGGTTWRASRSARTCPSGWSRWRPAGSSRSVSPSPASAPPDRGW